MFKENLVTQIVAVNNLGFIGKDDKLMWHCKKDLEHFKKTTMWNALIVGRKTLDTLPKAVQQGRYLIGVSRSGLTIDEAFEKANEVANNNSIYVIGGGEIYQETAKYTDFILLSRINNNDIGDTTFVIPDGFEIYTTQDMGDHGENGLYQIEIYKRTSPFKETSNIDMEFANTTNSCMVMGEGTFELSTEPLLLSGDVEEVILSIEDKKFTLDTTQQDACWKLWYDGFIIKTNKQTVFMGISSGQSCCEETGYFMSEDDISNYIGAKLRNVTITDTGFNTHDLYESANNTYDGDSMFVNIETNKGTLQFVAYNIHNGYYGHDAVVKCTQLDYDTCL